MPSCVGLQVTVTEEPQNEGEPTEWRGSRGCHGFQNGIEVVRQHPGCKSIHVSRCIEKPEQYMLAVSWISLEAHTVDFRGGPLFPQWRSHINGLFEGSPVVFHYQEVSKD